MGTKKLRTHYLGLISRQSNNKNISCTVDASNSIDLVVGVELRAAVLERVEENLTNILSCPQSDSSGNMDKDSRANVQNKIEGDGCNDANQGVKNDGGTIAIDHSSLENNIDNKISEQSTEIAANVVLDPTNTVIEYKEYESELQMQDIMRLIQTELSEPYSIYTYRYFIYNWPKLCFLAAHDDEYIGAIVCKLDMHMNVKRGYIAMLAVKKEYRKMKIGTNLVEKAIEAMRSDGADEVVLETEMKNIPALRLYENLGFVRDKRLFRYYLNGVDALRLKLWFR